MQLGLSYPSSSSRRRRHFFAVCLYKIIRAERGRSYTVVITEDGQSLAFGWNKHGQLGSGSAKNDINPLDYTFARSPYINWPSTVWSSLDMEQTMRHQAEMVPLVNGNAWQNMIGVYVLPFHPIRHLPMKFVKKVSE